MTNFTVHIKGSSEVCIQPGKWKKTFNGFSKGELKFENSLKDKMITPKSNPNRG